MNETVTNDRAMTNSGADAANSQVPAPAGIQQPNGNGAYAPTQPARSTWPAWIWLALAAIYFFSFVDIWPDPLPGGWIDDACVVWWAIKKWRNDKQQGGGGIGPQFQQPMYEEPAMHGAWRDAPERMQPPRHLYGFRQEVEKPGFFSRLFKAVMYLFTGGGAL